MICVVSHDAGGAEILSSYIRQKNYDCLYVLAGPALKIFQRKIKPITLSTLPDAIQHSEWLLCGTSWQSKLELQAIGMAKKLGKKAIAFLDHWVNYPERFIRDNIQYLPDEIWIGDKDSKELALKTFSPIHLFNSYQIHISLI